MSDPHERINVPNKQLRELEENFAELLTVVGKLDSEKVPSAVARAYARANEALTVWQEIRVACERKPTPG
jgi:hypothetical protein